MSIFNEPFAIFAVSWTAGIFGAAAFATFGPALERLWDRLFTTREHRRVRDLAAEWQPGRWPRRPR